MAGRVDIDFDNEPIGKDQKGKDVFLKDIWPTRDQVSKVTAEVITPEMFRSNYESITDGNSQWASLKASTSKLYDWDPKSSYIHNPPFFQSMKATPEPIKDIKQAYCLLNMGDSITTDHISPAGKIAKDSPAARFLRENHKIQDKDFNSYGSRRGNDEIMARGTFANI